MLAQLASHLRLDLIMLQEVSIVAGSGLHREDLGAGWTLHFSTADSRGRGGVGALVGPRLQQSFCCVEVSARLLRVDVRLRGRNARLFCAYAPTAAHPQEAGEFFELLAGQLEGVAERDTLVVLGDLNAVVQRTQRSPFVLPRLNANSVALADFMARVRFGVGQHALPQACRKAGNLRWVQAKEAERARPECHDPPGAARPRAGSLPRAQSGDKLRHDGAAGSQV
jgi:hypothetical protein